MPDHTKLGELLCRRGMLNETKLAQALENQIVYGGRLGTNLIELGLARLDDVARCLVIQRGVPQADGERISAVTPEDLALLPVEICVKYELFPLGRDDSAVHIAMTDPNDELIARLRAYFQEHPVKAYIVPELRLHFCLERYYDRQRPKRFLRLPDGGERQAQQRSYLAPTIDVTAPASPSNITSQRGVPKESGGTDQSRIVFAPVRETGTHGAVPEAVTAAIRKARESIPDLVYLDEFQDAQPAEEPSPKPAAARQPVDDVLARLDEAIGGSEIARALVAPLCPETATTVLFWVRGEMAVGCCAEGLSVDPQRVTELVIPLDQPSVFQWAVSLQGVVRASGEGDPCQETIAHFLGSLPPKEVCVAPVWLGGKVVNLICVHSKPGVALPEDIVADLRRVTEAGQIAYDRLRAQVKAR